MKKTIIFTLFLFSFLFSFTNTTYACINEIGEATTCPVGYSGGCFDEFENPTTCPPSVDASDPSSVLTPASTGGSSFVTIKNPLGEQTITGFFLDILSVILIFALPLIVFFIILAGFQYVLAQGNPEKITKATRALLYAIIGGLLILGANIILAVIQGTVDAFII